MAKRVATKSSKKSAKTRKTSKAPAKSKKKAGGKKASGRNPLHPVPVSTGAGASPMELGQRLVADFNAGKMDAGAAWSDKVVSIEGLGVSMAWHGRKAMEAKGAQWMSEHAIHGARAEGPYVGATGFGVKFEMDVETKATGKREMMTELAFYTVKNGKIVQEEFCYAAW